MALPQRSPAADNQSKRFALALVCKYTSRLSAHMILLLRLNYQKFPQIFRGKSRQKLVHLFPLRVLAIGLGIAATKRDCRIAQSTGCTRPALRASPMRGARRSKSKPLQCTKPWAKLPVMQRLPVKREMQNRRSSTFCGQKVNKRVQLLTLGCHPCLRYILLPMCQVCTN